jgi:hypothetical protein
MVNSNLNHSIERKKEIIYTFEMEAQAEKEYIK